MNRPYKSLTHLSTFDLNPGHGSVSTIRPSAIWTSLLHLITNAPPFCTDTYMFPTPRFRLNTSKSTEFSLINYRRSFFNKIDNYHQFTGVTTVGLTLLSLQKTIPAPALFLGNCFLFVVTFCSSPLRFYNANFGVLPLFWKFPSSAAHLQ